MKLRLNKALFTAVMALFAAPVLPANTLNLYILTGQSNSLGAVKGTPAPAALLQEYASEGLLWNGNMMKDSGALYDTPSWVTVAPQKPNLNGSNCMGPEYGFDYMMLRKGWGIEQAGDNVGVIKASLDGGGNTYWVKGGPKAAAYNSILNTVKAALDAANAEGSGYDSVNLAGLIYLQGESDGAAEIPLAQERYLAFFSNLKTDLAAAGYDTSNLTQSVLGECATWNGSDGTGTKNGATTTSVAEQKALADSREDIGWVRTRDLTKIKSGDSMGVHYDGKSEITIGARYAYAMALQQGWDVGHTRGDDYTAALNSADAWWDGTPTTEKVAVWDVSSANVEDTMTGDLELKGVRVEDPFRSETVIKNASGANATLRLGSAGIEVWGGHSLKILTNVGTTAEQTWKGAAGSSVTLGSASAGITLSGTHGVTLQRTGDTGVANFTIHASNADARTWTMGDGVTLKLGGEAWSNQNLHVAAGATSTLAAASGNALSLASLTLESGSTLDLGGSANLNLTVGALSFGTDSALNMNLATSTRYDKIILGEGGTLSGTANFNITVGSSVSASRKYVLFENWTGGDNYTFTATGTEGATLSIVNGNLVFRLSATEGSDFSKDFPEGPTTQTITAAGAYYAATYGDNTIVTRANGVTGNVDVIGAKFNTESGTTYAELSNSAARSVSAFGSNDSGNPSTVTGSPSIRVSGDETFSITNVYGGMHGSLTGDAYVELDATNATYGTINGVYNADITGSMTYVVREGVVNGNFTAGVTNGAKTITGGVKVQIDGGTFNGMVAGGNNAGNSVIQNGIDFIINGGTFKNYVIASGFTGTVNGDVKLTITGGDFSALNGTDKGIYAGGGSRNTRINGNTIVTLRDIDDTNSFATYTGILSGKNQAASVLTGTSKLVLDNYTVTNMVHTLQGMDAVELIGGSNTTVSQAKGLGSASSISIEDGSRLRLTSTSNWDLTAAALTVNGEFVTAGTFAMGAPTGTGAIIVESGTTSVNSLGGFSGTVQTLNSSVATVTTGNSAVTYDVGAQSTLNLGVSAGNQGTLTGAGRVVLTGEGGTNTTAFTMDEGWTGTVVLADGVVGKSGNNYVFNLNNYGQAGSTIELNGLGTAGGWSYFSGAGTFDSAFVLNGNADGVGLYLNAGGTGAVYAFTGPWTGSGALKFMSGTIGYNVTPTFHFKGDMTGYEGDIISDSGITLKYGYGDTGAGTGSVSGTGIINGTRAEVARTVQLIYDYTSNVTADNTIIGNVALTKNGYADLTLTGTNTYTGDTTIADGTLVLSGSGSTGTGNVTLASNTTLRTDAFTITAGASGAASLTATADGLSASSDTIASLTLNGATLTTTGDSTLNITGTLTMGVGDSAGSRVSAGQLVLTGNANDTLTINQDSFIVTGEAGASTISHKVDLAGGSAEFHNTTFTSTANTSYKTSATGTTLTFTDCHFGTNGSVTSGNAIVYANAGGTIVLGGETVVQGNAGIANGSKIKIADNANVTLNRMYNSSTYGNNGALEIGTGAHLTIDGTNSGVGVTHLQGITNNGILTLKNANVKNHSGGAAAIGTLDVSGTSSLTAVWGDKVNNIAALTGEGTIKFVNDISGTNTQTFNLGTAGKADSTAAFSGTIGIEAGAAYTKANRVTTTDFIIKEENIAANAVITFSSASARANNINLKLDAATVNVAGITTASSLHTGEVPVVSSTSGTKTLGLTGSGDYAAKVELSNVSINKTGSGSQTITGSATGLNGGIAVSAGSLVFDGVDGVTTTGISTSGDGSVSITSEGTLNLTGSGETSANVTLANVSINKTGSGSQTFTGDASGVAGIAVGDGTLTIKDAGTVGDTPMSVSGNGRLVFGDEDAQYVSITVATEGETATLSSGISIDSSNGAISGSGSIRNALLTIRSDAGFTLPTSIQVENGSITSLGTGLVSIAVEPGTSLDVINATGGQMSLINGGEQLTINELNLTAGQVFSAYKTELATEANEATLLLTSLTAAGDATLNANLVFGNEQQDAYTLTLYGTIDMGSSVSIYAGGELNVTDPAVDQVLFTGVDQLFINGVEITANGEMFATNLFSNAVAMSAITYTHEADGWTVTYTAHIPEPATATLSLLALAALAARRRRRVQA